MDNFYPMESSPSSQVSDDDFKLFHSIDRELYTRLIQNLGRDPDHSVQIMGFWMWLERESKDMYFIKRLLSLPLALLNDAVDETAICLRCVADDAFLFGIHAADDVLTLLPEILRTRANNIVSLRLFYENRAAVVQAVTKIINTVCARAFDDILRRAWADRAGVQAAMFGGGCHVGGGARMELVPPLPPPPVSALYHPDMSMPYMPPAAANAGGGVVGVPVPMNGLGAPAAGEVVGVPVHMAAAGGFPAYDFAAAQRQMTGYELGDVPSRNLSINSNYNKNNGFDENVVNGGGEVAADDRTIFLTFSKGYPISEDEVSDYFKRLFGDFMEDLIMQEVGEDEQVLYARMVARSVDMIYVIVGENKAKYVINGKHVWARKYVKKQHQTRWSLTGRDEPPCSSSSVTVHGEQSRI